MRITYFHQGQEGVRDLPKATVILGRGHGPGAPDFDLWPDVHVSRKHAMLTEREGTVWIEDLGSKLGTKVNGKPIQNLGERRLRPGDVIALGDTTLRVEPSLEPPSPPPPAAEADGVAEFRIEIELDARDSRLVPAPRPGLEMERRVALFLDLSSQLTAPTPLDYMLQLVLRRVMEVIPEAARGAVLLPSTEARELLVKACVSPDGPAVSGTLARRALEERRGFIWRRNLAGSVSGSIVEHRIATGIYAPLLDQDQALGVICVDTARLAAVFNSDDLRLLMAVAHYTALALRNHQWRAQLGEEAG
jgi:pSer/pThr/pTyr-binding forkhead associated (FHA) protein